MPTALFLLLATAIPARAEETKLWFVRVLSAQYYDARQRTEAGGRIGARLAVADIDDKTEARSSLYLTDDSNLLVAKIGGFKFRGMNEGQFRKFFSKARVAGVHRVACAEGEREARCVATLIVDPKAGRK